MRKAVLERNTKETEIRLALDLDQPGKIEIETGIGFFDHMLHLFAFRAGISLEITCKGDLHIDGHHTVEDVGLTLGAGIAEALGDKRGIARYGTATVPMDEALANCALDISGRPFLVCNATFPVERVGAFDTELTEEFFRALATRAGLTLHLNLSYGQNTHHMIEALCKAFGIAFGAAIRQTNSGEIPSTKGVL